MILFKRKIVSIMLVTVMLTVFFSIQNVNFAKASETNEYIVRLNIGESADVLSSFQAEQLFKFNQKSKLFAGVYKITTTLDISSVRTMLAGKYQSIQPNIDYQTSAITVTQLPNDPGFTTSSTNTNKQWGLVASNFVDAWTTSTGDSKVIVAVIDSGIDSTHEDLIRSRFIAGYDFINNKVIAQKDNSDDNGHGTLVAGIIAATTNNSIGIAGAAPQTSLMSIKALDKSGVGTSADIAEAIVWAADKGANIINLSLGGVGFAHDNVLSQAISYAFDKDVVIVAAAGNDVATTGGNLDLQPVFPICNDNGQNMIIGVTALDENNVKPNFANFGKACVDVAAPGKRIMSTINHDPITDVYDPDQYAYASGTSLAAPFVSAQAALLKAAFPQANNRQIRNRILATAKQIDTLSNNCSGGSCSGYLGSGLIDVAKSLKDVIPSIGDGDVVKIYGTDTWYLINGGKKQLISPFVRQQLYSNVQPKVVLLDDLTKFSEGSFALPKNGTLVKSDKDATVYYIDQGFKLPVSYQVFLLRGFKFTDVITLSSTEVNSWVTSSFLTPPEGSLIRTPNNPTVYWVVNQSLHAINYQFYIARGLQIFPVIYTSPTDLSRFNKGESYIL